MVTKAQLLSGGILTGDYRPTIVGAHFFRRDHRGYISPHELEEMRRDPRIRLALRTIKAPIAVVEREIVAEDPNVEAWLKRTYEILWQRELSRWLVMIDYGRSGGEAVWRLDEQTGLVELKGLRHIYPLDMQAMEADGDFWGIRIKSIRQDIPVGRCFYLVNDADINPYYGRSRLIGAWEPWQEKTARHGARDIRRGWFVRNVYRGGRIRYPAGSVQTDDGRVVSNQDFAREIVEKAETGGVIAMPVTKDPETGEFLWIIEDPQVNGDIAGVREYVKDLDVEILEGMEIPPEVIEAQQTGSWAGRSVPFLVFLTGEDLIADNALRAFETQVVRPAAEANFGKNVKYTIKCKSLVPKDEGQGGKPQGQGGMGGQEQPPPGPDGGGGEDDQPGGSPGGILLSMEREQLAQGDDNPEWTAYQGTHGGRGWKNVRTGEVLYQEEKPGTRGDGKQDDATPKSPAQPQEEQQDPAKEAQRQQAKADYKQNGVRAKSFKSWFGDWEKDPKNASKVVDPKTGEPLGTHPLPDHTSKVSDETGRPIAVFHGTPGGKFSEFRKDKLRDPEALNYGPGFYFTDKKDVAEGYAKGESGTAQGEVMTVFLNIRKPFKVGANKKYTQEEYDAILGNKPGFFGKIGRKISGPQTYTGDKLYYELTKKHGGRTAANAHLQKLGYDGVHDDALNGKQGVNCWIAFEGNQIKAADNEGTFDPNDNKIHMAMPEAGAWTHYQGPHGGHGWKNGATGEVVYQEEMPGSRGSDGRTGTPSPQAFKAWFGDSKVVDESGNPKFAYHGTTKDFDTFDRDKGLSVADKLGSWFSTDPNFAEARLRHRIDGMTGGASQGDLPQGSAMVRTYLSIRKPLELPSRKALDQYLDKNIVMPDDLLNKYKKQIIATWKDNADPDDEKDREKLKARIASFDHYATDENARQLINNMAHSIAEDKGEEGSFVTLARESLKDYDGIHILDDQGHGEAWVAFKPNQIKNKENSGAFNPDDPRINMAMPVIIDDAIRQRVRKLARKKYPGATEHLAQGDEWTRYQGPHGGHGWKRGSTGEIVYQEEMPGSHAKSAEAKSATTSAPPAVGDVMQFPATPNGRRAFSLKVKSVDDNHAVLGFANNEGGDFKIPAESLKQYRDDMMGIVDVPAGSDIPEINAVAQGKAKLLGHGDDGMAFDAGDKIVKVSSVVPFHPINHVGQRTPEEAIEQARQQFQTAKEMYQAGIPGIPKQSVRQVGDKVFTVREKLDIPKKFTPEQVKQVRQSLDAMHRAGYTLNDDIQVGIGKDGKVYHFDTGKAAKAGHPDDYDDDSHKFERFAEANGVESFPLAHYAEKQFASTEKRASKLGEHEAKIPGFAKSHLSFLKRMHQGMLEGNPERADEINRRYEEAVAKITGKS